MEGEQLEGTLEQSHVPEQHVCICTKGVPAELERSTGYLDLAFETPESLLLGTCGASLVKSTASPAVKWQHFKD